MAGSDDQPTPRSSFYAQAAIVVATVTTFARGVPSPLVETWDDGRFLIEFEPVRSYSWDGLVRMLTEVHFQAWHPLHLLSYWIDVPWAGPSGPVIHAVNLALWIVGLLLLLRVMESLGLPRVAALVATLALGLHPVQVEAVTWATGRKECLALIFSCLAILSHLSPGPDGRPTPVARRALPALFYVLAAMSKTTVLPLPGVLFLADVLLRGRTWRQALVAQVPIVVLGGAFAALVVSIWSDHEMIRPDAGGGDPLGRVALVAATLTHHVSTALLPVETSPIYPIDRAGDFGGEVFVVPALLLVLLGGALRLGARRAAFATATFLVLALPVVNILPVYFQYQDRYLSLPLLGPAYGLGAGVALAMERLERGRARAWIAVATLCVAALAARTVQYQRAWSSDERLWRHATATHPDAFYAWMKLGEYLRDRGDLEASVDAYRRATAVAPGLKLAHSGHFQAAALLDERRAGIEPSQAMMLTRRFHAGLDDADALRGVAGDMVAAGYRDAALLPLARSLDLEPASDEQLEQAAAIQLEHGNRWLARFYVARLSRAPLLPRLRELSPAGVSGP